jgi:hypothetical protein
MSKQSYRTDIKLGEKYEDKQTGIKGIATAVIFYQHGCERVDLETVVAGKIESYGFDAPRLTHVETQKVASTTRTGGPAKESATLHRRGSSR